MDLRQHSHHASTFCHLPAVVDIRITKVLRDHRALRREHVVRANLDLPVAASRRRHSAVQRFERVRRGVLVHVLVAERRARSKINYAVPNGVVDGDHGLVARRPVAERGVVAGHVDVLAECRGRVDVEGDLHGAGGAEYWRAGSGSGCVGADCGTCGACGGKAGGGAGAP